MTRISALTFRLPPEVIASALLCKFVDFYLGSMQNAFQSLKITCSSGRLLERIRVAPPYDWLSSWLPALRVPCDGRRYRRTRAHRELVRLVEPAFTIHVHKSISRPSIFDSTNEDIELQKISRPPRQLETPGSSERHQTLRLQKNALQIKSHTSKIRYQSGDQTATSRPEENRVNSFEIRSYASPNDPRFESLVKTTDQFPATATQDSPRQHTFPSTSKDEARIFLYKHENKASADSIIPITGGELSGGWDSKTTEELQLLLRTLSYENRPDRCRELAEYMVTNRKDPPLQSIFQALLTVNSSPEGSTADIIHLIDQMKDLNLPISEMECNSILRALAVHPDYILRTEILQYMERSWIGLNDLSHHLVVASMVRELHLERALEELEIMYDAGLDIKAWLYDLIVTVLVNLNEFEEALRVLRMRLEDKGSTGLTALWTHMLDKAAHACHVSCYKSQHCTHRLNGF
jgi:hypothetical protein